MVRPVGICVGAVVFVSVAVTAAVGCSTYDEATAPSPTGDASKPSADGGDGGAPPAGLLTNGGFESSSGVTCSPGWSPYGATSSSVSTAHSGMRACKVCNSGESGYFGVLAEIPFQPGEWVAQAYGRGESGTTAATHAFVQITFSQENGTPVGGPTSKRELRADDWVAMEAATRTDAGPVSVGIIVGGEGPTGSCVVVDDVIVAHF